MTWAPGLACSSLFLGKHLGATVSRPSRAGPVRLETVLGGGSLQGMGEEPHGLGVGKQWRASRVIFFFFWTGKVSHSRGSFAMVGLRLPAHCDVWGAWVLADQSSCREDRGQSMVVDTGRIVSLRARIWPAWWQVWQGLQDPQMAQVNGAFCLHGFSVPASSILASPATMAMSSTQKCTG